MNMCKGSDKKYAAFALAFFKKRPIYYKDDPLRNK